MTSSLSSAIYSIYMLHGLVKFLNFKTTSLLYGEKIVSLKIFSAFWVCSEDQVLCKPNFAMQK